MSGSEAAPVIAALNRIAEALERLADVYLYCNDPEDDVEQPAPEVKPLPASFKGMR